MGAGMESRTDSSTIIMGQETYLDNFLAIKMIFILKVQVYEHSHHGWNLITSFNSQNLLLLVQEVDNPHKNIMWSRSLPMHKVQAIFVEKKYT